MEENKNTLARVLQGLEDKNINEYFVKNYDNKSFFDNLNNYNDLYYNNYISEY